MKEAVDRFTIEVTDHGLRIVESNGTVLDFEPVEALMLLDVLKQEEDYLRAKAKARSPLPIRFKA